jgi:hypothetical protein
MAPSIKFIVVPEYEHLIEQENTRYYQQDYKNIHGHGYTWIKLIK